MSFRKTWSVACTLGVTLAVVACDEQSPPQTAIETEATETEAPEAAPAEPHEGEEADTAGPHYEGPPLACARAVVVAYKDAPHASEEVTRTKDEAKVHAKSLRARVLAGEPIDAVARAESDAASSGPRGGLLGTYTAAEWPPAHGALREPVFALALGERTEVIEAPYGYVFAERCPIELTHTRHILIRYQGARNAPDSTTRTEEEAATKAEQIRQRVVGDERFEDVAKEVSEDASAERGGDVGIQGRGRLAPEYEQAAYALRPGAVSPVVKTEFGYHIIQRME